MRELTDQEVVRREKMEALKAKGINPFGQKFNVTTDSKRIKEDFESYTQEQLEELRPSAVVAGRIVSKRRSGKAGFMHILDKHGKIQIYIRIDDVGEENYELYKDADLGDIIGVEGRVCRTNTGELTVHATKYVHLVKALRPLPEKFHGLTDTEERFRRRYVDLIMNEEARAVAFARPKIIRKIQSLLDEQGYVEVETPVLGTILGGATARPFITKHNTLDINMYLRIATELPLKRLLVGGMDAVYEIGRLFRNEGMDKSHNPEFTTIELYRAYNNLDDMMALAEDIFKAIAKDIFGTYKFSWKGEEVDLEPSFKKRHMVDIIKDETGINFFDALTVEDAKKLAAEHGIEVEEHFGYGHIVNAFYEKYGEPVIKEPTFVYGHPIEISPLATKSADARWTERFELFIQGTEFANAFTELNDPIDQYERFAAQVAEKEKGNDEANEMDIDYIEALEYGMPPAGGMGMGIDRMVMLFTNSETIREVILFPTMKPLGAPKVIAKETEKIMPEGISESLKAKLKCLENPEQNEFKTRVVQKTDEYIVLDETYFYPQGGGQPGDSGYINEVKITNTRKRDDNIIHEYEGGINLSVGDEVTGKIDWERRMLIMRAHGASHIMEYFLFKKFGEMPLVGNFLSEGKDKSTYEANIEITSDAIKEIEEAVNAFINAEQEIKIYDENGFQMWQCADIKTRCGGTHLKNTGAIGTVTIKRKGGGAGRHLIITELVGNGNSTISL